MSQTLRCDNENCENENPTHVSFPVGNRTVVLCGDCFNELGEDEECESRGCGEPASTRFISPYTAEVRTFCEECYELVVYGDDDAANAKSRMKGWRCDH